MFIKVNGELKEINVNTLEEVIRLLGFEVSKVVAVLNGEIVPKSKVSETYVKEGDDIEILTIMGGG
ncbi:MAG: sulfur carrier protein ThiS [bacterium]